MKIKDFILEIRRIVRTRNVEVREESDQKAILKIPVTKYSIGFLEIVIHQGECIVVKHFITWLKFKKGIPIQGSHSYEETLELVDWFFKNRFEIMKENSLSADQKSLEKDLKRYIDRGEQAKRVAQYYRDEKDDSMAETFVAFADFCGLRAGEAKVTLDQYF